MMELTARKTTTRTHEGKTFVPLAYKNRPYLGNVAIVKSFYNIDIIILVCCSLSLYTHYQSLRYWGSQVRLLPGAPVIPTY